MSMWSGRMHIHHATTRLRRLSTCAISLALTVGACETQAQRSSRATDQCFADPTLACLMDQANAALNESEYPDPDALLEIAGVLVEAGENRRAQPIFMRALDTTMMMGWPEMRGAMFMHAAEMTVTQLSADEARSVLRHAEAVARRMELPDIQAMAMQAGAIIEIEIGQFEQARDVLDEALDVAMQVPWQEMRQSQFAMLIDLIVDKLPEELARPVFEHALELADDVTSGYLEASFRADLASAQARLGDIDAALDMADAINNAAWRSGARAGIAGALAARGELDPALAMASDLDDLWRSSAVFEIALALVERGATEQALELAPKIADDLQRGNILAYIARAGLDTKDLDWVLTVAADITNRQTHTLILIDIVHALVDRGVDDAERRRLIDAVLGARELARTGPSGSANLHNLVSAFARLDEVDEAVATIDELEDAQERASALSNLASLLALNGDIDRAMEIATELQSSSSNSYLVGNSLGAIAAAHATEGNVDEALDLVKRIEDPGIRATALARIAVSLRN